jgi:hypothetical protein
MHVTQVSLSSRLGVDAYKEMGDPNNVADPTLQFDALFEDTLDDGRAADQADLVYAESKAIAASSNWDIDLVGSTDKTRFGDALAFARVKCLKIKNTGSTWLRVGGYGAGGFCAFQSGNTAYNRIGPGGMLSVWAPDATAYAVTAGSADILRITNEDALAGKADVFIVGCETDVSSSSSSSTTSTSSGSSASTASSSSSSSEGSASSSSSSANSSESSSSST